MNMEFTKEELSEWYTEVLDRLARILEIESRSQLARKLKVNIERLEGIFEGNESPFALESFWDALPIKVSLQWLIEGVGDAWSDKHWAAQRAHQGGV